MNYKDDQTFLSRCKYLLCTNVLIHFVNIVSALQVVNMVKFILQFLLLTVSVFNNVLCENNLNSFKVMTKIPSGHSVMESIAKKADATTLCQKHSEIYLNASSNLNGWAFQSNS